MPIAVLPSNFQPLEERALVWLGAIEMKKAGQA
jgi:hypothetical protein